MSRAQMVYVFAILVLISGCATTIDATTPKTFSADGYDLIVSGQSCTFPHPPACLQSYFTDKAYAAVSSCPITFVNGQILKVNEVSPDVFDIQYIFGFFDTSTERGGPLVTLSGTNQDQYGVSLPIDKEASWQYNLEDLVHEYLHAYFYLAKTKEEQIAWKDLWEREKGGSSSLMQRIHKKRRERPGGAYDISFCEPSYEMWAYIGDYLTTTKRAQDVPVALRESYRGILRDEFVDPRPQTTQN